MLAALVGSSFVRVTLQDNALAREAAGVQAEIALLEAQRAMLDGELALRKTDAYVEYKARESGYVRPGEGLASVRDVTPVRASDAAAPDGVTARLGRWLALFFHP